MNNNQLTNDRLNWIHDAATELAATDLKITMKPSELLWLTTELQERRKADSAEPPLNVSERAELQAFRRKACNHGFPPGTHTQGVVGCEKCCGRKVMIWELGGGHTHQIPGLTREEITPGMALHLGGEIPISAEFKAARNTLKFLNYTWTGGEHWRPPLGLPPESVTGIDYKKLVEEISRIVFGNLDHIERLPENIREMKSTMPCWVLTDEQEPGHNVSVLAAANGEVMSCILYLHDGRWWDVMGDYTPIDKGAVSHWMVLPRAPSTGAKNDH